MVRRFRSESGQGGARLSFLVAGLDKHQALPICDQLLISLAMQLRLIIIAFGQYP